MNMRRHTRVQSLLLLLVSATAQTTSAAGSDQADLATSRAVTVLGRRVTDVLVVTTTVRVLNGVHGNTTDLRPRVALSLVLVERTTSLQHRLVNAAATGDNANSACKQNQTKVRTRK
jgi:hypothetical protein